MKTQESQRQRPKLLPRLALLPHSARRWPPEMESRANQRQRPKRLPRPDSSRNQHQREHQGMRRHPLVKRAALQTIQVRGTRYLHQRMKTPMRNLGRRFAPHRKTSPKSLKNRYRLREQRKGLHHQQRLQKRRRLPLRPSLRSRWSHCPHYRSRQILTCH